MLQDGGQGGDLTVSQSFDNFGNLLTRTDTASQVQETNTYDLAGRLLTSTGPSFTATVGTPTSTQIVTHHTYDAWGHEIESWQTSTGEAAQTKADWTLTAYDQAGRASQVQRKLSSGSVQSTVISSYDGMGRLISESDTTVSGLAAWTSFDARGNEVLSWAGGACTTSYDSETAKATRHLNGTSPAYDALDRVLFTTNPGDTSPTTYSYYDDGRLKKETKPDGSWVRSYYDSAGNLMHTFDSVMQAKYPGESEESPTHYLTSAVYDEGGRKTSETDGNGLTVTYTYDLLGNLTSASTGAGTSYFTSNEQGWQIKIQDADGFATTRISDQAGRVTSETTGGNTSTYTFDAAGNLSHQADPNDRQTDHTYDWLGRGNRETQTLPGTPRVTVKDTEITYDSLGRVTSSTDNVRNLTHSLAYPQNTAGSTTDAQGVGSSGSDLVSTTLTIGADGYEASRTSSVTSSPQIPDLTRSIDPATGRDDGKRVTRATLQTDTSCYIYAQYGYDSAGRIIRQWGPDSGDGSGYLEAARTGDPTYTYNATSGLKTADSLQLQSVGTAGAITGTYTYDQNGRLDTSTVNGVSEDDDFDAAGNLTSIGPGFKPSLASKRGSQEAHALAGKSGSRCFLNCLNSYAQRRQWETPARPRCAVPIRGYQSGRTPIPRARPTTHLQTPAQPP